MNIMRCKLMGADCESDTVTLQLPAGQRPYGLVLGQQMVCTSIQDMDMLLSANADAERIAKERNGLQSLIDDAIALLSTGIADPSKVIDILTNDPMKQPAPAEVSDDRNPAPAEVPVTGTPLPCPHCGTPATKRRYQHEANRFFYACPNTHCNASHTDEAEALAAWNRRTLSTGLACQATTLDTTTTKETP